MAVAVFPRLGDLLKERNLTVADLEREIEQRFGVAASRGVLDRLADSEPLQQTNLEVAGAVARILGIELGELFDVVAVPPSFEDESSFLEPDRRRRLAELFDLQSDRELTAAEQAELEHLVAEYGRRWREHLLAEAARQRGLGIEQVRRDSDAAIAEALASYRALQADPRRLRSVIARAKRRAARASA